MALPAAAAPAPPLAGALASAAFVPFCLTGCGGSGCLVCMKVRKASHLRFRSAARLCLSSKQLAHLAFLLGTFISGVDGVAFTDLQQQGRLSC